VSTELSEVSKAVAEFDRVGAGLAALREQYGNVVYDVTTTAGMADAKAARLAIREPRYEIERIRKAAKAPILALGKKLDSEAARITSELEKLERPIDSTIKAEEDRKEAEKQAKIEAEQKRVANLQERVVYLRGNQTLSASSGSELIAGHIEDLEGESVEGLQEFEQQGIDAKIAGLARLRELHAAALAHEAEQERIKEERAELARLREEEQKRQAAERARIAEEERQARAAREHAAALQAEELRKQREAQEAENARIRAEQEAAARAERERIAEENKRLTAERAEFQRQQDEARQKRESEERERAEQARLAALKRPEDTEIVGVLAKHYRAPESMVIGWLAATNWKKAKAA
jgi:colicin import membrane protein